MSNPSPGGFAVLADMIRSDQMAPAQVQQFLADHPDFAAWYRSRAN